jgi:hypothetical protein
MSPKGGHDGSPYSDRLRDRRPRGRISNSGGAKKSPLGASAIVWSIVPAPDDI